MSTQRLSRHNVVGIFPTFAAATDALDALVDEAGIEARGGLSLLGPDHEMRPTVDHVTETNGEAASGTMTSLAAGTVGGTAVGTVAVTLAAVASTAIPGVGMAVGTAALAGAATGVSGGSVVGALFGLEAAGRNSTMWQQTLAPLTRRVSADGVVLVAAHVDDDEVAARARTILEARADEVHDLQADTDYRPELFEANVGVRIPSGSAEHPGGDVGPGAEEYPQEKGLT